MTTLADVQDRIERIQQRLATYSRSVHEIRIRPFARAARSPLVRRCGRCREPGHTWGRCLIRDLRIWTNGCELWIASSAEDVAQLKREADQTFGGDEAVTSPPDAWTIARRVGDPLTLVVKGRKEQRIEAAWIKANGRCQLAFDGGVLAAARKVPGT